MMKDRSEILKTAGLWLELKRAWETWKEGRPMPSLSPETTAYFENESFKCMNASQKTLGTIYENVPPVRTGQEAWSHVFHYLVEKRNLSGARLMDDLFLRAKMRANTPPGLEPHDELAHELGWLLNQFHMRARDATRAYAAEHGTPTRLKITTSLNNPLTEDEPGTTLLDITALLDPDWASALEREELSNLGQQVVEAFFPGVRGAFKLRLYLRLLRVNRDVTISVANKIVLALAGLGHSVFSESASKTLEALAAQVAADATYQELDPEAKMYLLGYAAMSLSERSEVWTHLGECVLEFLAENEKATPREKVAPCIIVERAEAFARLLHGELEKKNALLPENELEPLFHTLATARQQYCR